MQILGIDIGGTGIKAAIVETTTGALVNESTRIDTPRPATPEAVAETLKQVIVQHQWSGPIGIGFPAAIQRGIARTAANVDKSFIGLPIAEFFSRHTNCSVYMANDADAAGLAEIRFGAGKDTQGIVLIITIGTGLGTALFMDGYLLPNTELGHVYLDNGIEAERYASEAVRVVQKLDWSVWGARLNHYLTTMESLLWPDLIILGGGVSSELEVFAPWLTTKAPVVAASFLNQAGIVGAALVAEEALKKKH